MAVKKILAYISSSFCLLIVSMLTSCGLIDMEFDGDIPGAYDMQLDHDTVYVTQGEHFVLQPVFTPDSVSNREVFFRSANEEIEWHIVNTCRHISHHVVGIPVNIYFPWL